MSHALLEGQLTERLIGAFFEVYNELGSGFAENIYQVAMEMELARRAISFQRQPRCAVVFRDCVIGHCRPDFVVEDRIVIELKAVSTLLPEHASQVSHYLRATGLQVGLLFNFGPKVQIRRLAATISRGAIPPIRFDPRPTAVDCAKIEAEHEERRIGGREQLSDMSRCSPF